MIPSVRRDRVAVQALAAAALDQDEVELRVTTGGHEALAPRDPDAAVLALGGELGRVEVRAGAALAEGQGSEHLARGHLLQVAVRPLAAAGGDRGGGDAVHQEHHPGGGAGATDRLARLRRAR